ncbi:MAG: hypothetical protein OEZ38_00500 [Gammaproteobacteria bacterium]|nr:hypothetical protein [Gammaproteobacteria bacterium]
MGRFITLILISIAVITGFFMYRVNDVGYLTAGIGEYSFKTTLLVAGAALLTGAFILLLLIKFLLLLHKIVQYFGAQRKTRLLEKARLSLSQGLIELAEGRFPEAEKLLLKQVKYNDNALLAYLSAARAAQQQGEHERRDDYLRKAHKITPTAEIAIGLTKAELQLAHEQYEQALANLTHLYEVSPKHAYVIRLLLKTYRRLSDWNNIHALLNDVKHLHIMSDDKILKIELESWHGLLSELAQKNDLALLTRGWDKLPSRLKVHTDLVRHYSTLLLDLDAQAQAEQVLRQHLSSHWSEPCIVLYSRLNVAIDNYQLEQVETWLQSHQHNAYLLLALGKLCLNNKLWGKARHYLEASLSTNALPETYLKLAQLLEQHMDEAKLSETYYRKGLECLAGEHHHDAVTPSAISEDNNARPSLKIVQSEKL